MIQELFSWLDAQRITYIPVDTEVVDIPGFGRLFTADLSGVESIFRGDGDKLVFNLMESPDVLMEEGIFHVAFPFGRNWYYYDLREEFRFNLLKYIGRPKPPVHDVPFVNLGIHTSYELLNACCSPEDLCRKAKWLGHTAVGICDRNTMAATLNLQKECANTGLKHIFGYSLTMMHEEERVGLKIYALDNEGLHNLLRIQRAVMVDSEDNTLRYEQLLMYAAGCVVVFAIRSVYWMAGHPKQVKRIRKGAEAVYYQVDANEYKADRIDREQLEALKYYFGNCYDADTDSFTVEPVLIPDCYYMDKDDAGYRIVVNKIATGAAHEQSDDQYFKTADELYDTLRPLFSGQWDFDSLFRRMCRPTVEIAGRADASFETGRMFMPEYRMRPEERERYGDRRTMFLRLLDDGLDRKVPEPERERYRERLDEEVYIIESTDNVDYFLVQWDMVREAHRRGIATGIGRGSAGGSLVSYLLGITSIDPLKYDLLFERFLNPERISLPDVDVDFDEDGRDDVLHYCVHKYGQKRVAQIVTFGTMAPKLAIRDVARVQKLALSESDRLAKLVPDKVTPDKKAGETPFDFCYKESPELAAERESPNQLIRNTLKYAEKLEGSIRQTGVHACGVIIGQDDLENFAPMAIAKDADLNVVEFEGKEVESVGLIKMDFLGLRTLSIIKDAVTNVKNVHGIDVDIDNIPLDDAPTYEVFSRGDTTGLFQFESPGMKKHLRNLKPNRFEDLIAMNALYRPGPMEYIPNFIARKHGLEPVTYDIADMEEYLSDTYGITVYQEQVMLLSQKLAGFTGGEADTLRKAMGKKQRAVLDKMKPKFIEGCSKRGHDAKICEKIWGDWEAFASYAFNKSHSTCYAYIAYQTGYLKAHYPSEFMAALLSRNLSDIKQITLYMNECKRMGIRVLGPDINESLNNFSSNKAGDVRFGLAAVKGVGEAAVESIVAERNKNGKFKDIYDFFERVNYTAVNRKCLENIAYAGGFDSISGFHRCKFFGTDLRDSSSTTFIEQLVRYGQRFQSEKDNAQQSLFGGGEGVVDIQHPVIPACQDWSTLETLGKEREMIGLYLSAHPLDDYAVIIRNMCKTQLSDLDNLESLRGQEIAVAGMVIATQNLVTKTGKPWGKFTLEDYNGTHEFALFSKDYENFRKYLFNDYFLFIRGKVQPKPYNDKELEFKITSMVQLSEMRDTMIKEMYIQLAIEDITREMIEELTHRIKESEGSTTLRVNVYDRDAQVSVNMFSKRHKVSLTSNLVSFLEDNEIKYTIV